MKRDIQVSNGNALTWGNRCAVISIAVCAAPAPVSFRAQEVADGWGREPAEGRGTDRKMTPSGLTTGSAAYKGSSPKGDEGKVRSENSNEGNVGTDT